jgi:uncharacterized membrane protein (DUF485 family)
MARDDRFRSLKTRYSRAAALIAVSFLGWYLLYVLLAAFARDFMARPVFGDVTMALLLGLLQFVSTFLLAGLHALHARYALDPLAGEIRARAEADPAFRRHTRVRERPAPARPQPAPARPQPAPTRPRPTAGYAQGVARRPVPRVGRWQEPASGLRRDQVSGAWTDLGRAREAGSGGGSPRRPDLGTP